MPQRRKRRSQASDQYGLGADLLWKYKQAPRSQSKWEVGAQFQGTKWNWEGGHHVINCPS